MSLGQRLIKHLPAEQLPLWSGPYPVLNGEWGIRLPSWQRLMTIESD